MEGSEEYTSIFFPTLLTDSASYAERKHELLIVPAPNLFQAAEVDQSPYRLKVVLQKRLSSNL
jgi:hypothetical protein